MKVDRTHRQTQNRKITTGLARHAAVGTQTKPTMEFRSYLDSLQTGYPYTEYLKQEKRRNDGNNTATWSISICNKSIFQHTLVPDVRGRGAGNKASGSQWFC